MQTPIYLALDFASAAETNAFLAKHDLAGVPIKIGMELFYREGPKIAESLRDAGHRIFLDLKLHDIPTTVHKAMKNLARLDVDIVNVHALGGAEMIQAAKAGLAEGASSDPAKLIGVTMLTSMNDDMLERDLLQSLTVKDYAIQLAKLTKENGGDGVVCSPHEAKAIKEACGNPFLTVTPGIRLADSVSNDQQRIATPASARSMQADYLVIGRSVTAAADPKAAYERVIEEWNSYVNYV